MSYSNVFNIQIEGCISQLWSFIEDKFIEDQNKKFVLHSVNFVEGLFPGNYKGLQITQKLTCIKRVALSGTSTFGKQYTWYKM